MAADIDFSTVRAGTAAASSSSQTLLLDSRFSHTIRHLGVLANGTAETGVLVIGVDGAEKTADYSAEDDKVILKQGESVALAYWNGSNTHADSISGKKNIYTVKAAANAPMVQVLRTETYGGRG